MQVESAHHLRDCGNDCDAFKEDYNAFRYLWTTDTVALFAEFEEEARGLDALIDRFCLRMRQRLQAALVAERSERSPDSPVAAHARALGICVEVPAGARPGDYLRVQYGGAIVPFTVPEGASAGSRVCVEALSAGLGAAHASPSDRALDMRIGVRQAVSDARAASAAPSAARGSSRKRAR